MFLELLQNSWEIAEPIIGYTGIIILLWYWFSTLIARRKKYKNKGSKKFIVALQVGRPVSEAVKKEFGELDALIDSYAILGKESLESHKDYKKIVKEVYKALAQNQDSEIHMIISGPVGLNVLIGQLIGMNHFDVIVYQYDHIKKGYYNLPIPNRSWLKY